MLHIRDDFKNRFRIPAEEFNKVARFINNLIGGAFVDVQKGGSVGTQCPVTIDLKVDKLKEVDFGYAKTPSKKVDDQGEEDETDAEYADRCAPKMPDFVEDPDAESASDKIDRMGTKQTAARVDHRHLLPFWINPDIDGNDGTENGGDNVQPEDVYIPDEDEDTSDLDLSGSSNRAARADHSHKFVTDGASGVDTYMYHDIYKPDGTSHYYGSKVHVKINQGLIILWEELGVYDMFTGTQVSV